MLIYVSGLYAGGNPQPGVGILRSLRQAYPDATLVGVEYSNRVSGIHFDEIDELWIQRPWAELDLDAYADKVRAALDAGGFWISGSDLEAMWLASVFPVGHPNLLAPPMAGLKRITKPAVEAAAELPVGIPTYLSTEHSDWDLHAFCRKHDWRVWLKGPYYDASRTPTWDAFTAVRNALSKVWSTEKLFLQAHVSGYEESVMLSAYKGVLLGAVSMRKRDVTPEGKTWAGAGWARTPLAACTSSPGKLCPAIVAPCTQAGKRGFISISHSWPPASRTISSSPPPVQFSSFTMR